MADALGKKGKGSGKMSDVWFTGDSHFGHESKRGGIIAYCNRPFACVEEMDDVLIGAWNSRVGKKDVVYHLGDFTLSGWKFASSVLEQLKGEIHVLWNRVHHDRRWIDEFRETGWERYTIHYHEPIFEPAITVLEGLAGPRLPIVLCHYPFARWDGSHFGSFHLFGHCHGNYQPEGLALDVGVDNAYKLFGEYRPIHLDEVREYMEGRG